MRNVTVRFSAVLLMAAAGVMASHATSLADPETPAPTPTESPAPTPTESAEAAPAESSTEPSADAPAPKKSTTGGHEVTYTITATSDLTGNISYIKTDPPSMSAYNANSSEYLETVRVPIGGGAPLVYTTTLADPSQWALVTASGGLRINPEFHCEIAVDGEVVVSQQGGSGVTCSTRAW
ncbi:hypothetical protein K6T79_16225 [Mycolicibacter sp. MYC098]|uniref:MmpS family membrane protein n=2 Tax=[Mycobacterium] crassicus TaxID=2872309 RepID=A0ABU5XMR0_9MYCO|nr:hypothetical protein [Mycolicibacter sp. MYC098]MEB3022592.1 hypothetical protein [Mycolicibacter sp. MYC098]